jgi:histone deacetylase HOS3
MRKVKISLVTKEQREAREQAKAETKPTTARPAKATTARAPKPKGVGKPDIGSAVIPQAVSSPMSVQEFPSPFSQPEQLPPNQQSVILTAPTNMVSNDSSNLQASYPIEGSTRFLAQGITRPNISEPVPTPTNLSSPAMQLQSLTSSHTPDVFIPYQPEGPAPQSRALQNGLQWLPPNTATPSASKFGDLPVFTSTGTIPFGIKKEPYADEVSTSGVSSTSPNAARAAQANEEGIKKHDIWDVPDTPRK